MVVGFLKSHVSLFPDDIDQRPVVKKSKGTSGRNKFDDIDFLSFPPHNTAWASALCDIPKLVSEERCPNIFLRLTPFLTQACFLLLCRKTNTLRIGCSRGNHGYGASLGHPTSSEVQTTIITYPPRSGETSSSLGSSMQRLSPLMFQAPKLPLPHLTSPLTLMRRTNPLARSFQNSYLRPVMLSGRRSYPQ